MEFHNSLWAPAMSGSAATTLPWWWRDRIEPHNLFFHYRAIRDFVRDVPWNDRRLQTVRIADVRLTGKEPRKKFSPVLIAPFGADWDSKSSQNRFRIEADGSVPDLAQLRAELFGKAPGKGTWRNPLTFDVNFPEPGRFIVRVHKVSHGILEIALDGKPVITEKNEGTDVSIDVPAGRHEVTLDNTGNDLVRFGYIVLTNYRDATHYPDLGILGQQTDDFAALWIHNRLHQWPFKVAGFDAEPVGPATASIAGLKDGRYRIEWWDTYKGRISKLDQGEVQKGTLKLCIPAIERDVACKIRIMIK